MTGRSRWPELERTLRLDAFLQVVALVGAVALAFAFPGFEAPAVQVAGLAGIGALAGFVLVGVLEVWFYVRPTEIEFGPRRNEPRIVVGMVPQVAELFLMVCLVLVGVSLSWQFGHEQMSLTRRGAGPYVPAAFVAVGMAGLILWHSASWLPGWRSELVITARGIASRGMGRPFTAGWDEITAIREVNNPGSMFPPGRIPENYIAIGTLRGVFRIRPQDLKPSPYDVFMMLKELHEKPALRSRIGGVSSTDQLLAPLSARELAAGPPAGDLPVSRPRRLRDAIIGLAVAAIAVPYAVAQAGDTPFYSAAAESEPRPQSEEARGAANDPLQEPDFGDGATCRDLHSSRAALARLLEGLQTVESSGKHNGRLPRSQQLLNAAEAVASYAETELEDEVASHWMRFSAALEQGAENVWYIEQTGGAGASTRWKFVAQQVPNLRRATRQALRVIDAECS